MDVQTALKQLNQLLPLAGRQAALPAPLAEVHRAVLRTWIDHGRPPQLAALARRWPNLPLSAALARLAADDLLVLSPGGEQIAGAYPLTLEETPHRLRANGHTLRAMCALDALAVGPLFGLPVEIESICRVTGAPIFLRQNGVSLLAAEPSGDIRVGIHWQPPQSCAAHSLCREMVFLVDAAAAAEWQAIAPDQRDGFSLAAAIELGAAFFAPLLAYPVLQV